jgi:TPR repeat protein
MSKKPLDAHRVYTDHGSLQQGMWGNPKAGKKGEVPLSVLSDKKLSSLESSIISGKADFQQGIKLFLAKHGDQALPHFEKSVKYPPAYLFLYYMYNNGCGVCKDISKADEFCRSAIQQKQWFHQQAATGNPDSQFYLGLYYEWVGANPDKAAGWYFEAAKSGHAGAQANIGFFLLKGIGVVTNKKAAVFYLLKAAAQNSLDAQFNLGCCYEKGEGVDKDMKLAVTWFRAAAEQGDVDAEVKLGWCYGNGEGVAKDTRQAKSYYTKAVLKKHPEAQRLLDSLEWESAEKLKIEEKEHTKKFDQKSPQSPAMYSKEAQAAVIWHQQKADMGDVRAQTQLGWYYQEGIGIPRDTKKAVELYLKAADKGNSDAQNNLGWCCQNGMGIDEDLKEAISYYKKAADQGNALAQYNLGRCYQTGTGVEKDIKTAVSYYLQSAAKGYMHAQINLGWCYQHGAGVAQNEQEAAKWYRAAAATGNNSASAKFSSSSLAGNPNNVFKNRVRLSAEPVSSWRSRCQI